MHEMKDSLGSVKITPGVPQREYRDIRLRNGIEEGLMVCFVEDPEPRPPWAGDRTQEVSERLGSAPRVEMIGQE